MPAGKKLAKGGIFGQVWRTQGIVGDGIPVDASGAEAQDAEAAAVAIGFGKVAVLLQAEAAGLVLRVDMGHASPDAVRPIAQSAFEAEGFANGGMNAVTCDDEIGFGRGAIFKVKKDGVGALFQARKGVVQVDGAVRHGLGQGGLQFGAMNGDAAAIVDRERKSFDAFAAGVFHDKPAKRAAARPECGKNTRVNLIEGSDGIGPKAHARANFFQLRRTFVDVHRKANLAQGDGGGESADAAADDCRTFHNGPPKKNKARGEWSCQGKVLRKQTDCSGNPWAGSLEILSGLLPGRSIGKVFNSEQFGAGR